MDLENIKAKVSFYYKGNSHPIINIENIETLKNLLDIKTTSENNETEIKHIRIDDALHEIIEIKICVLKETRTDHIEFGIDMALVGEPMDYNIRVKVFVRNL